MKYINFKGFNDMKERLSGTVVIYGTGRRARNLIRDYIRGNDAITNLYAVSDDISEQGRFYIDDDHIPIYPIDILRREDTRAIVLILDNEHLMKAYTTLQSMNLPDNIYACIAIFDYMSAVVCGKQGPDIPVKIEGYDIPKVIYSFWFSGEELPPVYRDCIRSWHEVMPDYEVRILTPDDYDCEAVPFMKSAMEHKRWAYVSDYARLDVLYKRGGIYLDMDVRAIRSYDDLLSCKGFFAYDVNGNIDLGSGFGSVLGNPLIGRLLKEYEGRTFTDRAQFMQPQFLRNAFLEAGLYGNGDYQELDGNIFYPRNYFAPYDSIAHLMYPDLSNTYSIHLYNSGWLDEQQTIKRDRRWSEYQRLVELIGKDFYNTSYFDS